MTCHVIITRSGEYWELEGRQGVQQLDCLGKEIVTQSGTCGWDAPVPHARWCRVKNLQE